LLLLLLFFVEIAVCCKELTVRWLMIVALRCA
jgi:hypothetical protein